MLHVFCSAADCADGETPYAGLIQDAAGNLYGTTLVGGAYVGDGTVFEVYATGGETALYSFCNEYPSGCLPYGRLIEDATGNLYGTTRGGGENYGGTVFELDSAGQETLLYSFCSAAKCADGDEPYAGLIQDAAGNLYGTTYNGGVDVRGSSSCPYGVNGCGTVFKVDSTGHETVLYRFCSEGGANCTDGAGPVAGLIQAAAGNLYGSTASGGVNNGGVVFELTPSASVTLTSSVNPSYVGQSVIFSAVVSGSGATPTGSVTFEEGTTDLGTVTLSEGQASLTTTFTRSGTASVVASYSGDENYEPTKSKPLKQVVKQYATSTALTSSPNPSNSGQPVTFTATVSSAGPTPTGRVMFKNGSKSIGSASLSGGVAKITTSKLPVGTLTITASYVGDAANAKSTSPPLTQVVN